MSEHVEDNLWPHFVPLWTDLHATAPKLLLAGGYALILKHKWLDANESVKTLIDIRQWRNAAPHATKDFDFIAGLDLIASSVEQKQMDEILQRHDFKVVKENARWQFSKQVGAENNVVLDFHAPSPLIGRSDLRVESRRVKPNPSLKQVGIHGRENAEAVGCELHPFTMRLNGIDIVLPNPVTLACMKLTAMRDRRLVSQDATKSPSDRRREADHATKHAHDVCRVIAMVTLDERENAISVVQAIRAARSFSIAAAISDEFFQNDGWGARVVANQWKAGDLKLIQNTLAEWFHSKIQSI